MEGSKSCMLMGILNYFILYCADILFLSSTLSPVFKLKTKVLHYFIISITVGFWYVTSFQRN